MIKSKYTNRTGGALQWHSIGTGAEEKAEQLKRTIEMSAVRRKRKKRKSTRKRKLRKKQQRRRILVSALIEVIILVVLALALLLGKRT